MERDDDRVVVDWLVGFLSTAELMTGIRNLCGEAPGISRLPWSQETGRDRSLFGLKSHFKKKQEPHDSISR